MDIVSIYSIHEKFDCNLQCPTQARGTGLAGKVRHVGAVLTRHATLAPRACRAPLPHLPRLARPAFLASPALSMVHMYESFILVLLCQRGEIAVDLVRVATGGSHLNRQMFDAKIGADFGADGVK